MGLSAAELARIRVQRIGWVAAVVVAAAAAGMFGTQQWMLARDPMRQLVAGASVRSRSIQPRLSGDFPYAPLAHSLPGAAVRADALAAVMGRAHDDRSPVVQHAAAVALILAGKAGNGAAILQSLDPEQHAKVSNDLAVAHYQVAIANDEPARLVNALVAVDAALRTDPALHVARFNRALVLEALGLRDRAREEWTRYLRVDSASGWAAEARGHVRALAPVDDFKKALARDYDRLASDPAAAAAFARRFRQMARTYGEAEMLGDWASATIAGDRTLAGKHLRIVRAWGDELARNGGNQTTKAIVAVIDAADADRAAILARAHLHFADGRRAFMDERQPVKAHRLYSLAAGGFARAGSPAEVRARLYTANMLFEQGKFDDARAMHEQLLAAAPPEFPAQRAESLWILGTIAYFQGQLGPALDRWTESHALYDRLDETNYAARMRAQMVFALDRLGNPTLAWKNRMVALRELGRQYASLQAEALASITHAAVMNRDWPAALSFLALELDVAQHAGNPNVAIQSLLYRAEVYRRIGKGALASGDVREVRRRIAAVPDPSYRAYLHALANGVEASLTTDPQTAIELLTEAIDYQSTKLRRVYVPELLRRRGRLHHSIGDLDRAAADFEAGIAEIERHRQTLRLGEDRWGIFHAADELFADAIELAVLRGDAQTAFEYAERSRARSLLDTVSTTWRRVTPADVPHGSVVVEYAIHEEVVFIFVVDHRHVRVIRRPMRRAEIATDIAELIGAGRDGDALRLRHAGRMLHRKLIEPVEKELSAARTLAIIPDPTLGGVPFAALVDGAGRYLVETHAVAIQPSAAFYTRARKLRNSRLQRSLVVFGGQDLGRLAAAEKEARAVARIYERATLLEGARATAEAFGHEARLAEIVHFAGHSVASTRGDRDGYLLVAGRDTAASRLETREIAAMRFPQTALVILAACGTADGEIRATEGSISVARAFLASGVPSVVGTLWAIDDEASEKFFVALHRRLARGIGPAEALRDTQIEWIGRAPQSPEVWAAVQVMGD